MDTNPHPIESTEWKELMEVPAVRDAWGIGDDMTSDEFKSLVYGAKFNYVSGGPGYIGDLFILQGDALTDRPPVVLKRDRQGKLIALLRE